MQLVVQTQTVHQIHVILDNAKDAQTNNKESIAMEIHVPKTLIVIWALV
jgi:hypothetical protein